MYAVSSRSLQKTGTLDRLPANIPVEFWDPAMITVQAFLTRYHRKTQLEHGAMLVLGGDQRTHPNITWGPLTCSTTVVGS